MENQAPNTKNETQLAPESDPAVAAYARRRSWFNATSLVAALAIGAAFGMTVSQSRATGPGMSASQSRDNTLRQLELFADVLSRVRSQYVVPTDDTSLIENSINGMLQSLDPHSSYMNPRSFNSMQVSTRGEYGGLGLEVTTSEGAVQVITPMDDSPGARAGIKAGDKIVAINGTSIVGLPLDEAVDQMRGPAGSTIDLSIVRDGSREPLSIRVTREVIVLRPVTHRMEGNVGYVRISTFVNENTGTALNTALDAIERSGGSNLKGLVIDLRNNGGGLLDQAIAVTDTFMDLGEIVSTRGRRPTDIERFYGHAGERMKNIPIVILTNEGTASASEIVAGALQDRGRAVIVGTGSFGKGSVQTVIPLNNGRDGALRLTTARYYTPSGRSIQGAGIQPDIEIAAERVTAADVERRRAAFRGEESLPHALDNGTGATRPAPHMPVDMPPEGWPTADDYQLKRAIALLNAGLPAQREPGTAVAVSAPASQTVAAAATPAAPAAAPTPAATLARPAATPAARPATRPHH